MSDEKKVRTYKKIKVNGVVQKCELNPVYIQLLDPKEFKITREVNLDGKDKVFIDYERDGRIVGVEVW